MDLNAQHAAIEQLTDASRQLSDAVATSQAELSALRVELGLADEKLVELRMAQLASADRVERLSAEMERLKGEPWGAQLEAVGAAQVRDRARIDQLEGQLRRLDRAEAGLTQLRDELGLAMEERERNWRNELQAQARQRGESAQQSAQAIQSLVARMDGLDKLGERQDQQGHRHASLLEDLGKLAQRIDDQETRANGQDEALRRTESVLQSRIQGLDGQVSALDAGLRDWQSRIEAQSATLQEAKVLAEAMRVEAEALRRESHSNVETVRVAEARMDASLKSIREESEDRWTRFMGQRRQDWEAHLRSHEEAARADREALAEMRQNLEAADEALQVSTQTGLEVVGRDLIEIKHRLGAYFRGLGEVVATSSDAFETQLPSDDPTALAPERRQALRRALRARRSQGGG
jgi:chromosome segregation ATPase